MSNYGFCRKIKDKKKKYKYGAEEKHPYKLKHEGGCFFFYYYYFCSDIAEKQGTVNYFFFLATDMAFGIS